MSVIRPRKFLLACDGRALCMSVEFTPDTTDHQARMSLQSNGWGYVRSDAEGLEWVDLCPSHYAEYNKAKNEKEGVLK